jgi:hypothetical protein
MCKAARGLISGAAFMFSYGDAICVQAAATPMYENDRIRVVGYDIAKGENADISAQPPYIIFALGPYTVTAHSHEGNRMTWESRFEDVRWLDRAVQRVENTGDQTAKFLVIEIMKPVSNRDFAVAEDDGTRIAPQQYAVLFENNRVRVIRVRVRPGDKTMMHSHPGSAFRYGLQERERRSRFTFEDGTTREQAAKGRGEARWSEVPSRHIIENIGANDIHNLLVEVK